MLFNEFINESKTLYLAQNIISNKRIFKESENEDLNDLLKRMLKIKVNMKE